MNVTRAWIARRDNALTCPNCGGEMQRRNGGGEVVELYCSCCEYADEITVTESRRLFVEPPVRLF